MNAQPIPGEVVDALRQVRITSRVRMLDQYAVLTEVNRISPIVGRWLAVHPNRYLDALFAMTDTFDTNEWPVRVRGTRQR